MMLREDRRRFTQTVRVPSYYIGGGGLAISSYNFYRVEKSLIYSLFCSIYGKCRERGLVENVVWGGGEVG